ncbi:sensor histidine kinase [Ferruginibacter sp.]
MKRTNCKIAFNDKLLMLFAIPLLSFIIPIVFFGCRLNRQPYFNVARFFSTFIIIVLLWMVNRYILIWCRKRYPRFSDVRKRLLIQISTMLLVTLLGNNLLHYILTETIFTENPVSVFDTDHLITSNAAAMFCLIMIIGIYESIYFMHELRSSVQETENLKRENLAAQLNALRTQVNPHFLFNNLNTLISLIPENPDHAVDFVQQLSKVYRHILEVKDEKSIPLKDELDVLHAYTFLMKTRFDKNLEVNVDVPAEKLQKRIVPLSLQILMENAIKHNIVSSDKPLQINVFTDNGSLVVSNNLQMKKQVNESTGIGLNNIRNRYKMLSDAPVKVTESETNFTVSIPLIEQ